MTIQRIDNGWAWRCGNWRPLEAVGGGGIRRPGRAPARLHARPTSASRIAHSRSRRQRSSYELPGGTARGLARSRMPPAALSHGTRSWPTARRGAQADMPLQDRRSGPAARRDSCERRRPAPAADRPRLRRSSRERGDIAGSQDLRAVAAAPTDPRRRAIGLRGGTAGIALGCSCDPAAGEDFGWQAPAERRGGIDPVDRSMKWFG